MTQSRKKLLEMADKYQQKADKAYLNYQETGTQRYQRESHQNEDLADALRMAANAADDYDRMVHLRCMLADVCYAARRIKDTQGEAERAALTEALVRNLVACGKLEGL